jgi:hypothetical protein
VLSKGEVTFFGAVDQIGSERQANTFEIAGHNVEQADLEAVLKGPEYSSIYYSGVASSRHPPPSRPASCFACCSNTMCR